MKLRTVFLEGLDGASHLHFEDHLLRTVGENEYILLLYQMKPSVVLGRFQNPWKEVNMSLLNQHQVKLLRRQSGGGTIYADEGGLIFSFIASKQLFNTRHHITIIQRALVHWGITVTLGERSTLLHEGLKFSGSAFKNTRTSSLHHGTLLLKGNGDYIQKLLTSDWETVESVSTNSTPHPMTFLEQYGVELTELKSRLQSCFDEFFHSTSSIEIFHPQQVTQAWPWVYAQTPLAKFRKSLSFESGIGELAFEVMKEKILSLKLSSRDLSIHEVHKINAYLGELTFENFFSSQEEISSTLWKVIQRSFVSLS